MKAFVVFLGRKAGSQRVFELIVDSPLSGLLSSLLLTWIPLLERWDTPIDRRVYLTTARVIVSIDG